MHWIERNKDLLALLLSLLAITLTLYTVLETRKQARLASYMRLHEALVSPGISEGRRLLFLASRNDAFPVPSDPNWDKINQALALYDSAGVYMRRGLIPKRLFLEAWHHPLREIRTPTQRYLEHARQHSVNRSWASLALLLDEAMAYKSKDTCCAAPSEP